MSLDQANHLSPVEATALDHDNEIPGAGPTRILALEEGDAVDFPHEVDTEFRRLQPRRPSRFTREENLEFFRNDFTASTWSPSARVGCLRDWRMQHPTLTADLYLIADSIDPMVRISMGRDGVAPPPEPAPLRPGIPCGPTS